MKIILVAIDTLRADHLGCYGYRRDTSPAIDRLRDGSMLFEQAIAPISYTQPSFVSVFTSLYPSYHYQQFSNSGTPLERGDTRTLPEILKGSKGGLNTAAFVSSIMLSTGRLDIQSGFDVYDEEFTGHEANRPSILLRRAKETTGLALGWLKEHYRDDFLLFLHYMDVHGPYTPPLWYKRRYLRDSYWRKPPLMLNAIPTADIYGAGGDDYRPGIFDYQLLRKKLDRDGGLVGYEKNADYYISQYDANIRYVDDQIGRLTAFLRKKGIYEDTAIVLFSDHGEAFGENGVHFFHGLTVTMDQVRVPLLVKLPGAGGDTVSAPVSLLDIMPTLLDFHGLEDSGGQGVSLLDRNPDRVVYSQQLKQLAVISGRGRLLCGKGWLEESGASNMFESHLGGFSADVIADSQAMYEGDGREGSAAEKDRLISLAKKFAADANRAAGKNLEDWAKEDVKGREDEKTREQLKALGYMG